MFRLNLRFKIVALAVFAASLSAFVIFGFLIYRSQLAADSVKIQIDRLSHDIVGGNAQNAYDTVATAHALLQREIDRGLGLARDLVAEAGGVRIEEGGEPVLWEARNQITDNVETISLPRMLVGDEWLGQVRSLGDPVPVVDPVAKFTEATCTIFQRMNDSGDMLRVATNVPTLDNQRAISTYIPARRAPFDGELAEGEKTTDLPDPVVSTILRGDTFRGTAFVVNAWYLTVYEPIYDESGKVVGMLYVGVKLEAVPAIRLAVERTRVGESGFLEAVYAKPGKRKQRGEVVVSARPDMIGEQRWQMVDYTGKPYVQELVTGAIEKRGMAKQGELPDPCIVDYLLKKEDGTVVEYVSASTYFEPWDWVLIAKAPRADFAKTRERIAQVLQEMILYGIVSLLLSLVIAAGLAWVLAGNLAGPIQRLARVSKKIASGDIVGASEEAGMTSCQLPAQCSAMSRLQRWLNPRDETDDLNNAMMEMIANLNSLVSRVQKSSIQLVSTATQINATARQEEATVSNFGTSSNEIAASAKEISATSQELSRTMDTVANTAEAARGMADQGRAGLESMTSAMQELASSTQSVSNRLADINSKAASIGSVITTITKVADQTNLLSLNAAIEAEKAGEYGLGFAVVAREVRRLADQAAVATLEIEKNIQEMQTAVGSGVSEMEQFSERVQQNVSEAVRSSESFGDIIEHVQTLIPQFEQVNEGMRSQSQGAVQISESMTLLTDSARQSAEAIKEFHSASEMLHNAVRDLKEEVSRFHTSS